MILGQRIVQRIARSGARDPATGRWQSLDASPVDILASVQPLSGSERQTLPEGDRQRVTLKLYTRAAVLTVNQFAQAPEDVIVVDGVRFRVYSVETQGMANIIPHAKVLLMREPEAAAPPVPAEPVSAWDDDGVWIDDTTWLE
jgi:hypothetical protein